MTIRLQGNLSRLNMEGKRSDAAFLRGNATCKDCNAKYQLSVNDKPSNDESFVIVLVIGSNEHLYNHKTTDKKRKYVEMTELKLQRLLN